MELLLLLLLILLLYLINNIINNSLSVLKRLISFGLVEIQQRFYHASRGGQFLGVSRVENGSAGHGSVWSG